MRWMFVCALAVLTVTTARATIQKTTQDKVYTKEQAARGEKQYATICASCHDPSKVPAGKKPGPELVGDKFLGTWDGRTLGELQDQILTTMPNDGSAVLTEDQTADLVAYILQANKQPDGTAELKYGASSKDVVIKKVLRTLSFRGTSRVDYDHQASGTRLSRHPVSGLRAASAYASKYFISDAALEPY